MNRFFVNPDQISRNEVVFPPDIVHQIRHVLRMKDGEHAVVLDDRGHMYVVSMKLTPGHDRVSAEILSMREVDSEPKTRISLCFGLTGREKVEWILQKGTEIGVSSFYPFISSRTLVQSVTLSAKKRERWEKIIREAAEQSNRGKLPVLYPPCIFKSCLDRVKQTNQLCLIAWEEAESGHVDLDALVRRFAGGSIALFVGPEGGFSQYDVEIAKALGYHVVSLGKRILRMETAAIVFPAVVLHAAGES
jgi:16S rRNA (uracil1498-N3)-methyltransferase